MVESRKFGVRETVVVLQTPDDITERTSVAAGTGEEGLGVEAIDERRVQVVLRLCTEEMADAVHGAKIRRKLKVES